MATISRRQFVRYSMMGVGGAAVSTGMGGMLTGCAGDGLSEANFDHGVASGDPLQDRVIIWTRVTPVEEDTKDVRVYWDVATDEEFSDLVDTGSALTNATRDFTMKVDAVGLSENQRYFYRFRTINATSLTGKMKTLPAGDVEQVKFIVMSCSNYPAGYFHPYAEAAKIEGVDAALHLGDYLYEYDREGYASEDAARLGREVMPDSELFTLDNYRTRYAQYRTDPDLQAFHQAFPMIAVWDDHEVANDTWREGAENHDEATEGSFVERLRVALQAYAEWMPIRPPVDTDVTSLYRHFEFGDLVNLIMLDTRIVGRDIQLSLANYFGADGSFDFAAYSADVNDENRTLLGQEQTQWLMEQVGSDAQWQVLGQQVLMGKMELPGAVATAQLSIREFAELAQIAQLAQTNPELLTPEQLQLLQEKGSLLQLPNLPYNLDAWDGYPFERNQIFQRAYDNNANLVVLAGDTHNAWANNLLVDTNSATDKNVGVEFATASVSSPGLEAFLGLDSLDATLQTEVGLVQLITHLQYTNLSDRGFLAVSFTRDNVDAQWVYTSSIKEEEYSVLEERGQQMSVTAETNVIS